MNHGVSIAGMEKMNLELTEGQKREVKGLLDRDAIDSFIERAEACIRDNNMGNAMLFLVSIAAKYPDDPRVIEMRTKYENNPDYLSVKKKFEEVHKSHIE